MAEAPKKLETTESEETESPAAAEEPTPEDSAESDAPEAAAEVVPEVEAEIEPEAEADAAPEAEAETTAEKPQSVKPEAAAPASVRERPARRDIVQTVGRRKESVARVLLRPGRGEIRVNGRHFEEYFPVLRHRAAIEQPFKVTDTEGIYDALVRASGGGLTGQAEATQLGVARALVEFEEERRGALREHGLLTRDPRAVERKKPGRPKARKRFQFSKR